MATIKAIEGRSVHQIQSGQVIVDLTSVVKELVENSLDAGATSIEVRLKNQGLDSIEVLDNGKGIAPEDFDTIALKHYTSKLSSYEDLTDLDTFGFRGEALSSLCALSKFHIITARNEDGAVGKKLDFETSGKLKSTSVVAAQRGTTISVENLFCNLPVRRKELEKNIKREYGKVIGHLHAYACISVGVRFAVSNQMPKGKKVAVFSTKCNTTTKENVTNVFGAKTLVALLKLNLHLEMEPSKGPATQGARNWSTQATDRSMAVQIQGHVSKPIFGEGRQAPDRQMFFVNSRPCGLPQVSKAFNEVYKSFNVSQSPFIFANLIMDTHAYDVNVSPDKRSIVLHDQTALLERLKSALTELFEQTDHTVPQSQLPSRKLPSFKPLTVPQQSYADDEATGAADSSGDLESDPEMSDGDAEEKRGTITKPSVPKGTPLSLIQSWAGRETEQRRKASNPKRPSTASNDAQKKSPALIGEQPSDVEQVSHESTGTDTNATTAQTEATAVSTASVQEPDPMGSAYDDLFSQRPVKHQSRALQDFNELMGRRYRDDNTSASDHGAGPTHDDDDETTEAGSFAEPAEDGCANVADAAPAIRSTAPSAQKSTPGPVQNAFDRMRPSRTPLQTAQITIGDKTTTTVIGSDSPYKRRRIHQPNDSQAIARFGSSPLLTRGLAGFAAPGSQLQIDSSNLPDVDMCSPSPDEDENPEQPDPDHGPQRAKSLLDASFKEEHAITLPSDVPTSDALDMLVPAPADDDTFDEDYMDEDEKKIREDAKVARLIEEAEIVAAQPTEENLRRASQVLKNGGIRKEATRQLAAYVETSVDAIAKQLRDSTAPNFPSSEQNSKDRNAILKDEIDDAEAESRLSLTVSKSDFERMFIVGQFNLGFVLAVRPASGDDSEDELFIIDQHAADEKYNYERLQRTVTLQNQRLVRPKVLDLTAIEEEIILNHSDALKANGFEIETTSSDEDDGFSSRQCRLLTLPMTGEKTFDVSDLEELLHLLSEAPSGTSEIPRPKKVQKVLAMRACRSSIMVGKTLTSKQMQKVVRHMGEMEKPWNCPHGRPTMRHLAGLSAWGGWQEGDVIDEDDDGAGADRGGRSTDWKPWLSQR